MDSCRVPHAAAALAAAAILAVTLVADDSVVNAAQRAGSEPLQLADLLRNVILFAPLGASLAWSRLPALRTLLVGAVLSAFIELAQIVIPGRNPNPIDCVTNVAGVGLAFALFRSAPAWLHPPAQRARRLALVAGAVAASVLVGTGALLAPAPSAEIFYGHRSPLLALAHLAPYGGTVLGASIDGIEVPHGKIADSERMRTRLRGNYALRVDALAGTPPGDLAAFVLITDAAQTEILLLGPDRDDLVYRFRSRSQRLGLETASVRLPHALRRLDPGDRLELGVQRSGGDLCFAVDGVVDCGHGFTVGDGWLLLAPDSRILTRWRPILDAAWLAALFLPLGYWGRRNQASAAAWAVATTALFLAPAATALQATPVSQIAGAGFGAVLGMASRRHFEALPGHPHRCTR